MRGNKSYTNEVVKLGKSITKQIPNEANKALEDPTTMEELKQRFRAGKTEKHQDEAEYARNFTKSNGTQ
jgi:hypothetical protein